MIPPLQKTFGTVLESSQVNAAIRCIWHIVDTKLIIPENFPLGAGFDLPSFKFIRILVTDSDAQWSFSA
jgi:hypothetical protein